MTGFITVDLCVRVDSGDGAQRNNEPGFTVCLCVSHTQKWRELQSLIADGNESGVKLILLEVVKGGGRHHRREIPVRRAISSEASGGVRQPGGANNWKLLLLLLLLRRARQEET